MQKIYCKLSGRRLRVPFYRRCMIVTLLRFNEVQYFCNADDHHRPSNEHKRQGREAGTRGETQDLCPPSLSPHPLLLSPFFFWPTESKRARVSTCSPVARLRLGNSCPRRGMAGIQQTQKQSSWAQTQGSRANQVQRACLTSDSETGHRDLLAPD